VSVVSGVGRVVWEGVVKKPFVMAEPKSGLPSPESVEEAAEPMEVEISPSNPRVPTGTFMWHTEDAVLPGGPILVSIAEVMSGSADTISVRLYYRPEDTPQGRMWRHGDDEVLASRRNVSLSVDIAAAMLAASAERGPVTVLSYRDYARTKAAEKRLQLASTPPAIVVPPPIAVGTARFFVRDDYRDPLLQARDPPAVDDLDI